MSKKQIILLLLIALGTLTFLGCGGTTTSITSTDSSTDTTTTTATTTTATKSTYSIVDSYGKDLNGAGAVRFDAKVQGTSGGESRYLNFVRLVRNTQ